MAGLYIHIPFCKQACHYCNFHFSTSLKYKSEMVNAICQEIELQKDYLQGAPLETIYFGGGTPSLLSQAELEQIFERINRFHSVVEQPEITLEANPDDLSRTKLQELAASPINRLSIGIQSFAEADLQAMNRAHNAEEAKNCILWAKEMGFENLTIDLIYGSPTTSDAIWEKNLEQAIAFDIPHISSYCLTVEPQTALDYFVRVGKAQPIDEAQANRQFEFLIQYLQCNGFVHYEISNFAKPNSFACHNSNYWKGVPYLGIGPSAHSFNGESRQWNIAHNAKYLKALQEDGIAFEQEILTSEQRYNEYVMTGLRTIWGCDLKEIRSFGAAYETHFLKAIHPFLADEKVLRNGENYVLSTSGKHLADGIAMELFFEE
ncbi:MAG: radical SAM family heme chaperone HemW [Bacteroidota bacterium]